MIKCGLIGLPNVGKSTLFNAITQCEAPAENYPFCTIEPNQSRVEVQDSRIEEITRIENSKKYIPAAIDFVDIAGLVKGASLGRGMGNKFLKDIGNSDVLLHVVRCYSDDDIIHVSGEVDPMDDIATVVLELLMSDIGILEVLLKNRKLLCNQTIGFYRKLLAYLEKDNLAITYVYNDFELELVNKLNLLTLKPIIMVANTNFDKQDEHYLEQVRVYAQNNKLNLLEVSIYNEYTITCTDGLSPNLNKMISLVYNALDIQTYFTTGPKETRAWTIPRNCLAPAAAGKIHSDFCKYFIRCKVVSYKDFMECKGLKNALNKGKIRSEGKSYIMQEGDIVEFLSNK